VWHVLVIDLVAVTVDVTIGLQPWRPAPHLALYLGVVAATSVVATASFCFIEQPFLRIAAARR
jgi:peptidoglycan/LPS O-acetylase OafA/YrhL